MKVPSEEATALSRMADAAAAAAAFTAEGLRDDLHRPSQQAQRAELAKRAQHASDAVLRGGDDQGLVQQRDRRSYSRSGIHPQASCLRGCSCQSAASTPSFWVESLSSMNLIPEQEQTIGWVSIILRGFARQKAPQLQGRGCHNYTSILDSVICTWRPIVICSYKPVEVGFGM